MRVNIADALPFNIDRYVIEKLTTTSIETVPGESAISVYPNPARSDLHVSFGDPSGSVRRVELFNVLGQLVRAVDVRSDRTTFSLDGLPSGVYVIRMLSGGEVTGQRIVVKQ